VVVIHPPVRYPRMGGVARRYGDRWCHMAAAPGHEAELHELAARLGIARRHFQSTARVPHYDVRGSQFARAVELGARPVDSARDLIRACRGGPR